MDLSGSSSCIQIEGLLLDGGRLKEETRGGVKDTCLNAEKTQNLFERRTNTPTDRRERTA